jgi:glycosyltransferase involved in cell wall biosynthesis
VPRETQAPPRGEPLPGEGGAAAAPPRAIIILALISHYIPAFKAGGPLRSLEHLVEQLGDPFTFRIVTADRDWGDPDAFSAVVRDQWVVVGNGAAIYLAPAQLGPAGVRRVMASTPHDVLYLNSLFHPRLTLVPLLLRRLGLVPRRALVIAPRGELHPGALRTGGWGALLPRALARRLASPRQLKKLAYIRMGRALGLFRDATWQASNSSEADEIRALLGRHSRVVVAPDLAARPREAQPPRRRAKQPGVLRVIYLSRIDAKKNLGLALRLLARVRGEVEFDIHGPVTDERYWAECQEEIARLPRHVRVRYHGPVEHARVTELFAAHDLFLFPTNGENFGHVVLEALGAGCPVLVSDCTPWRQLEAQGVGWDLPLEDEAAMVAVLQRCVDMGASELTALSERAVAYGARVSADDRPVRFNRQLFSLVVRRDGRP